MRKSLIKTILDHPDREEIISKLLLCVGTGSKAGIADIHEWLEAKYIDNKKSLIISEKSLKAFQDNYLDIYDTIQQDLNKTKNSLAKNDLEMELTIKGNSSYKEILIKTANEELDLRSTIKNLCLAIETRLGQVFDEIQENPRDINYKLDRVLIEYTQVLGDVLEKYYRIIEAPAVEAAAAAKLAENTQTMQHHVTIQVLDQHISVVYDCIRELVATMDLESSFRFMEAFNDKMSKLRAPAERVITPTDMRLAEAKVLNETITERLNA